MRHERETREERQARVLALRAKVRRGEYRVDPDAVAGAILERAGRTLCKQCGGLRERVNCLDCNRANQARRRKARHETTGGHADEAGCD